MVPAPNRDLPTLPLPQSLSIKAIARRPACGLQAANSPPRGREKWFAPPQNAVFCAIAALLSAITQNTHFAPFFAAFGLLRPRRSPARSLRAARHAAVCAAQPLAPRPRAAALSVAAGLHLVLPLLRARSPAVAVPSRARPVRCCPAPRPLPWSLALAWFRPDDVLPVTLARDRQHVKIKSNLAVAP